MDGRISAGFVPVWLLVRMLGPGLQPWKTELPSFVPLRRNTLNLMWGEEIVLNYFGDIWTASVHASVGS